MYTQLTESKQIKPMQAWSPRPYILVSGSKSYSAGFGNRYLNSNPATKPSTYDQSILPTRCAWAMVAQNLQSGQLISYLKLQAPPQEREAMSSTNWTARNQRLDCPETKGRTRVKKKYPNVILLYSQKVLCSVITRETASSSSRWEQVQVSITSLPLEVREHYGRRGEVWARGARKSGGRKMWSGCSVGQNLFSIRNNNKKSS